jgi:hypothetical protein
MQRTSMEKKFLRIGRIYNRIFILTIYHVLVVLCSGSVHFNDVKEFKNLSHWNQPYTPNNL